MVPLLSSSSGTGSPSLLNTSATSIGGNHVVLESLKQRQQTLSSALLSTSNDAACHLDSDAGDLASSLTPPHTSVKDSLSIAVGPAVLFGGTSVVYSAAAKSSSLSPIAATCMLLLALQYSLQPRISKKYIPTKANKKNVALVEEGLKTLTALVLLVTTTKSETLVKLKQDWSLSSSLIVAGIPACLYAIQGVLTYTSYQNLDPITFNGLQQTKIISAALFCFLLLGKRQSPIQIVALGLVTLSALLFQGTANVNLSTIREWLRSGKKRIVVDTTENKKTDEIPQHQERQRTSSLGVATCLLATAISGLAGSLSQKGLQMTGINGRNAYLYTVEVSLYSAICLLISKRPNIREELQEWNAATVVAIMCKALGGLLTAFVHKYAGSVTKGFALILGLVLTGAIQALLDKRTLTSNQIMGTALVLVSSWLHFHY